MDTTLCRLTLLMVFCGAVAAIMMPVRRPPPMRQIHRLGPGPQVIRVRGGPVKRIYVPMNVMPPQHQRYVPSYEPAHWKPKAMVKMYQHGPQAPNRILPQPSWPGPMRKARNPKPKFSRKPVFKYPPKTSPAFDSYRPQPAYHSQPALTDNYSPQKTSYHLTAPTYGKPHPAGSPEPPKDKTEDAPTSYMHVYQGDKATKEGKPTYGYTQSHTTYEETSKSSLSKTTNHRPVYKPKSETTEDSKQGSFQPPKQTFGFTPYEDSLKESSESYSPNYNYKKQPETVLSPNYFDQNKS